MIRNQEESEIGENHCGSNAAGANSGRNGEPALNQIEVHPCRLALRNSCLRLTITDGRLLRIHVSTMFALTLTVKRKTGEQNLPAVLPAVGLACGDYQ